MIINEKLDILHFHGKTGRYLEPPSGEATLNILKLAKEGLRIELRTAIHKAFKNGAVVVHKNINVKDNGNRYRLNLAVKPLGGEVKNTGRLLMVVFDEGKLNLPIQEDAGEAEGAEADQRILDLEQELNSMKESLQTAVEELETSNEELKSTNEELQSTNEELETSKEELQSINEELVTVNSELQSRPGRSKKGSDRMARNIESSKSELGGPKRISRRSAKPAPPDRREAKRFTDGGKVPEELSRKEIERLVHELEVHQIELEMQNRELRRAQLELEASRNKYLELYDFAPVGYFTFDEYGVILDLNLTGAAQLGTGRKNLVRRPFHLHIAPEHKAAFRAHMREVLRGKERRSCELRLIRIENQNPVLFFAQLDSLYLAEINGAGKCRTVVIDITARRSAEETIRETGETLQALIHAAPLAIYAVDTDGLVRSWNRAAERIFGWRREEVIGYPPPTIPHEKMEEFASLRDRVLRGETLTGFETTRQRKDGSRIPVSISTALLYHMDGSVRGLMAISEDITERKRSEEEIIEMNRALQEKNRQVEAASHARKSFFPIFPMN